jgi:hypothetical protein
MLEAWQHIVLLYCVPEPKPSQWKGDETNFTGGGPLNTRDTQTQTVAINTKDRKKDLGI